MSFEHCAKTASIGLVLPGNLSHTSTMTIHFLTAGGTIDKVYFDAQSEFQVGEPQVVEILKLANVTFAFATSKGPNNYPFDAFSKTHSTNQPSRLRERSSRSRPGSNSLTDTPTTFFDHTASIKFSTASGAGPNGVR